MSAGSLTHSAALSLEFLPFSLFQLKPEFIKASYC